MSELVPDEAKASDLIGDVDISMPMSLKHVTKKATHELERQIILKVLKANSWNRQRTAKWLKISYRSLLYKLSALGRVDAPRIRRTKEKTEKTDDTSNESRLGTSPRFM